MNAEIRPQEFRPLDFDRLLDWWLRERRTRGTVFGLHEDLFRLRLRGRGYALRRRGCLCETPVGVAAGPHTQLAQNIVAAWLCGARVLELKTVQASDALTIARPCIDMTDEGYNCEWSQELPLDTSLAQYVDAWTLIRLLQHEAGGYDAAEPGFLFDLSVGYDLAGITSAPMQRFLDRLDDVRGEVAHRLALARPRLPWRFDIALPRALTPSVTLSTMHGCPPEEIERIGRHLIEERGLATTIKLNPTLLGAEAVRELLGARLGYTVDVPDDVFANDLDLTAAVAVIDALAASARRRGVEFGVKLTNTLACRNRRGVLPASESMVYLSGRALHPVAVHAALALQEACGGALDVSFAGGVDSRNVARVLACGLRPATACSDLLRPGGYQRLHQYLDTIEAAMTAVGAGDLDALVNATSGEPTRPLPTAMLANLRAYAREVVEDPAYQRATYPDRTIKTDRALTDFDCIEAPCRHTCPAHQDAPEYLHHVAAGDDDAALAVVLRHNPLPTVTGMVCDRPCEQRCTRVHYDAVVGIRDVKRYLAHRGAALPDARCAAPNGRRVAVIGAGPAGLACADALVAAGVSVTVFEARAAAGGMVAGAIPAFRLRDNDLARDLQRLVAAGVDLRCGEFIAAAHLDELRRTYDAVFVGVGAQGDRPLGVPGEDRPGVVPALHFLRAARRGETLPTGESVVVIGGGNTAMDAARTAVRLVGGAGVRLVYRRTRAEMPAAREELQAIVDEGVTILALLAPMAIAGRDDGRLDLTCRPQRLGAPDASGRPRPEPTDEPPVTLVCDVVVPAVGQVVTGDLVPNDRLGGGGEVAVYWGGDARRGPATIVDAIADGRLAAAAMLDTFRQVAMPPADPTPRHLSLAAWQDRAARLVPPQRAAVRIDAGRGDFTLVTGELTTAQARAEAARCLDCGERCDVCVSVCPNRANLGYDVRPVRWPLLRIARRGEGFDLVPDGTFVVTQTHQTYHVVDFCNLCGNCTTFCPTDGAPFRDKPRFAMHAATYREGDDIHLLTRHGQEGLRIRHLRGDTETTLTQRGDTLVYATADVRVELNASTFAVQRTMLLAGAGEDVDLRPAARLAVLLRALAASPVAVPTDESL